MLASIGAHGVGEGVAGALGEESGVGVCIETGDGVAAGAQAATSNNPATITAVS